MPLSPEETVSNYKEKMHNWELKCKERIDACKRGERDFENTISTLMSEYMEIFREYCSSTAIPRSFCFSQPPEYESSDKIIEVIDEREICKIIVECKYHPNQKSEFRLVCEDGKWRILERNIVTNRGTVLSADL